MDPDVRDLLVLAIPTIGTVLVAYFKRPVRDDDEDKTASSQ